MPRRGKSASGHNLPPRQTCAAKGCTRPLHSDDPRVEFVFHSRGSYGTSKKLGIMHVDCFAFTLGAMSTMEVPHGAP